MPMTRDEIRAEAMTLDAREREALAEELLRSIWDEELAMQGEWIAECQDRIAAVDRGEMSTKPGEQVMSELYERLKR